MSLTLHTPYPGVALVVTPKGSVLFGAPADAFKATKQYCADNDLPFPRDLVAPQQLLIEAAPQYNPEFFLYDFLFIYGAAFKPNLADERLHLIMDEEDIEPAKNALRITLVGPSRDEMTSWKDKSGKQIVPPETVRFLADVSENMAIRKGDAIRQIDDMVTGIPLNSEGSIDLLGGAMSVRRNGTQQFIVSHKQSTLNIDLRISDPVIPFSCLPVPAELSTPATFAIKSLGTRSGFDLSGPTTGYMFWINGRCVIYDGPVGTRYLLESQGISPEDVDVVILSHCHEDHMGAFIELLLGGYTPKVITTEPIYRSAITKLASYFKQSPEQVAKYIDYHRIEPGEPVFELGARFDFFYAVHAIPTIGVKVSMQDDSGVTHAVQISGDMMHHEGLDKMHADGVLKEDEYQKMRHLVPSSKTANTIYFADVGEAIIHGHPKDWADNPNEIYYYHCPDNEHTSSFGHPLAVPGDTITLIEPKVMHPAIPGRLLSALRFLELNDPGWIQAILYQGNSRTVATGDILASEGDGDVAHDRFTVVISGMASVHQRESDASRMLRPGEFFGIIELVDDKGVHTATIKAETPMELFDIRADVFHSYIKRKGLTAKLEQLWKNRPLIERSELFGHLETPLRNEIALAATHKQVKQGDVIIAEGGRSDGFFLLLEGEVEVKVGDKTVATITRNDTENFFGEVAALHPKRVRNASIVAKSKDVSLFRIAGGTLRRLFKHHMGVRYALMQAMDKRSGSTIK